MSKTIIFSNKSRNLSLEECGQILKDIGEKMSQGNLILEGSGTPVNLDFPKSVDVDIEVKEKSKGDSIKKELEIEISWSDSEESELKIN